MGREVSGKSCRLFSPALRIAAFALGVILFVTSPATASDPVSTAKASAGDEPRGEDNLAYRWGTVTLDAIADDTLRYMPRPTVNSHQLYLVMAAMFDAWTRYDERAEPVYLTEGERRPAAERTRENKEQAISFAVARVLEQTFPLDWFKFKGKLHALGYDPSDESLDPTTPVGVGNLAARAVLRTRAKDGSNMLGDHPDGPHEPYADYTGYEPVNPPGEIRDIDRWQPKTFKLANGTEWVLDCLTPHWHRVKTFGLTDGSQLRPGPPPRMGDERLVEEIKEVIDVQANLTMEDIALVEFMRDGPHSVQQAGHWMIFGRHVSKRDQHNLDDDVKMYFLVAAAALDSFVACWDAKMHYDNNRPYQQVHHLFGDEEITGWGGQYCGIGPIRGSDWQPYSPSDFLCPPFPAYPSGHSTVSGACSKALELFTGSDTFGAQVELLPGRLTEPGITDETIVLDLPTFSRTADLAGWSRVLGGYHIQTDNVVGLQLGRDVAHHVFERFQRHVRGEVAERNDAIPPQAADDARPGPAGATRGW